MDAIDVKRRKLGRIVWDIADVEQSASAACGIIRSSEMLSDEDDDFLFNVVRVEENEHDRSMRDWASRMFGPRPRGRLAYSAFARKELLCSIQLDKRKRFAYAFANLYWNEAFNLRWAPTVIDIFKRIDHGFAMQYSKNLLQDEPRHVEWGRRVIEKMDLITYKTFINYYDYLTEIMPTVMHNAHMKAYKKIDGS